MNGDHETEEMSDELVAQDVGTGYPTPQFAGTQPEELPSPWVRWVSIGKAELRPPAWYEMSAGEEGIFGVWLDGDEEIRLRLNDHEMRRLGWGRCVCDPSGEVNQACVTHTS